MRELLDAIGWSAGQLARTLGVAKATVDTWLRRKRADARVIEWLRLLADFHRAHPKPEGWEPRSVGRPPSDTAHPDGPGADDNGESKWK